MQILQQRLFAAGAYLLGIPALYIVLTEHRKKSFVGYHGTQAFFLWGLFLLVFFGLRFLIDLVWSRRYIPQFANLEMFSVGVMGLYAVFCAYRCMLGRDFKIPR